MKLKSTLFGAAMMLCFSASASVSLTRSAGWLETAYAEWSPLSGYNDYHVYVRPVGGTYVALDKELIRNYGSYYRADALGLSAGDYQLKVVPVSGATEVAADATETGTLTVAAHDRAGFAHQGRTKGIGAYNNDGTLKAGAKVIYVYGNNAKTVQGSILYDKTETTFTGLQAILGALEKGTEKAPICVRIIGCLKAADMDAFGSSAEGLQIKGRNKSIEMNVTIEGVGEDATIHGFGILCRNANSVEFRNFGIMLCMDDCISLDTDNLHIWVHHMDFFYGGTGSDADQAKGDGTVDIKGKSSRITMSYCHFWDAGKASLGGMKSEADTCVLTYHHNWFDHSDSRHPRIRTMFFHVYNNYYDGNSKYGVGVTTGGSAFVENNYFRNCKYPMMSSQQGTDATGDGTFSGEAGGVIKSFGNQIVNARLYTTINAQSAASVVASGNWDAYEAASRDEVVPASVVAKVGGTGYTNYDTNGTLAYAYTPDAAADVKAIVTGAMGAGRMNHGDFAWQFDNSVQDINYDVITALKSELSAYTSRLVGFCDPTLPATVNNGGFTGTRSGGDAQKHEDYLVNWGNPGGNPGGNPSEEVSLTPILEGEDGDFYWFDADNDASTLGYMQSGFILADTTQCKYSATLNGSNATNTDTRYGSIQLNKGGGYVTFYYADSLASISMNLFRTGSYAGEVHTSDNGTSFSKVGSFSDKKGEISKTFTFAPAQYVRVVNNATGSMHIHGVKLYTADENAEKPNPGSAVEDVPAVAKAQKVLIDGKLYIQVGEALYTSTGVLVK